MIQSRTLCLLNSPSPYNVGWTHVFRERAESLGWAVIDAASQDVLSRGQGDCLVIANNVHDALAYAPTAWVFASATDYLNGEEVDTADHDTRGLIIGESLRCAQLNSLAGHAAFVAIGEGTATVDAPYFGRLDRAGPRLARRIDRLQDRPRPLSIYRDTPIAAGAEGFWGPELFTYPTKDVLEGGGSPSIDLTGRYRPLLYGPYIYLPRGMWRAEVCIAVDPQSSRVALKFEWGGGDNFVAVHAEVTSPGSYIIALDQQWEDTEQAQVRLWVTRPVFEGRLDFLGVRVIRLPDNTTCTTSTA